MDYNIPTLERSEPQLLPSHFIDFHRAVGFKGRKDRYGVHFFIQDRLFERVWNAPKRYIKLLRQYQVVLTPDFDIRDPLPRATQIWNTFRSRVMGRYWQDYGINVIPTIRWSDKASYSFCFEGIPAGGTIAITTIGIARNAARRAEWLEGVSEAVRRLTPLRILVYGSMVKFDSGGAEVVWIPARKVTTPLTVKTSATIGKRTQYIIDNPDIIKYYAKQYGVPAQDFEDLQQEIILKSMTHADNYKRSKSSLRTWSSNFVRIAVLAYQTAKSKQERLFDTELFDMLPSSGSDLDNIDDEN